MTCALTENLRDALVSELRVIACPAVGPDGLRLPARGAAAGFYVPAPWDAGALAEGLTLPAGSVFGVPLIQSARAENGWLLLELTNAFYSAVVETVIALSPLPDDDFGSHLLNRLIGLARKPGRGCPPEGMVQRALLECLCLGAGVGLARAERTLDGAFRTEPLSARQGLIERSGAFFGAAARLVRDEIRSKGR